MLTQENIEEIILSFISKKLAEVEEIAAIHQEKYNQDCEELEKKWGKIQDFHEKYFDELNEIWPVEDSITNFLGFKSHFGIVFHEMSCRFHCLKMHKEQDEKEFNRHPGFVHLTYKEISNEIGLNTNSVKKYVDILSVKGKIEIKRDIGGLFYKLIPS